MRRTHEPQSVPALLTDAIWRGVQAPASWCSRTCRSVTPKQEHTYTRSSSRGSFVGRRSGCDRTRGSNRKRSGLMRLT